MRVNKIGYHVGNLVTQGVVHRQLSSNVFAMDGGALVWALCHIVCKIVRGCSTGTCCTFCSSLVVLLLFILREPSKLGLADHRPSQQPCKTYRR
jgi:hypothetical protein